MSEMSWINKFERRLIKEEKEVGQRESLPFEMDEGHFIFVKIFEPLMPMARDAKYDTPIHNMLVTNDLGRVTGGGAGLTMDKKAIEYVGIDLEVKDLDKAMPQISKKLRELGAPKGTCVQVHLGKNKMSDITPEIWDTEDK